MIDRCKVCQGFGVYCQVTCEACKGSGYEIVSNPYEPNQVTFTAHPIETAPRDRTVMLFDNGAWIRGRWDGTATEWLALTREFAFPTHWAEIEEMKP